MNSVQNGVERDEREGATRLSSGPARCQCHHLFVGLFITAKTQNLLQQKTQKARINNKKSLNNSKL